MSNIIDAYLIAPPAKAGHSLKASIMTLHRTSKRLRHVTAWMWTLSLVMSMHAVGAAPPTVEIAVDRIVAPNVLSTAMLYRAACLDEANVFAAAEKLVRDYQRGALTKLPTETRQRIAAYAINKDWLSAQQRSEVLSLATARSQLEFEKAARSPEELFDEFARLVRSPITMPMTSGAKRQSSASATHIAARELGITLSHRGYGASHFAAEALDRQIDAIIKLLETPEILQAYGAANTWEEVDARLTGKPAAEVMRLTKRGQAALDMAQSIERNLALVAAPDKADEFYRSLDSTRNAAGAWVSNATKKSRSMPVKKLRPLCLDTARRITPCHVVRRD